jgi:hypothetical protein
VFLEANLKKKTYEMSINLAPQYGSNK